MSMPRRKWLLSILVLVVLTLSLLPVAWAQGPFTLTILHTNDTHAHLESFEPFNQPLQGGVAWRGATRPSSR